MHVIFVLLRLITDDEDYYFFRPLESYYTSSKAFRNFSANLGQPNGTFPTSSKNQVLTGALSGIFDCCRMAALACEAMLREARTTRLVKRTCLALYCLKQDLVGCEASKGPSYPYEKSARVRIIHLHFSLTFRAFFEYTRIKPGNRFLKFLTLRNSADKKSGLAPFNGWKICTIPEN